MNGKVHNKHKHTNNEIHHDSVTVLIRKMFIFLEGFMKTPLQVAEVAVTGEIVQKTRSRRTLTRIISARKISPIINFVRLCG